jgi:CelD/BcsL family acetyltransferase involved in cellulose biosynthesis
MRLVTLDEYPPELASVAERSSDATFYHSPVWIDALRRVFPSMSFRCLVAEEGNQPVGYLPFFYIHKGPVKIIWSMPFGTYGGPVTLDSQSVRRTLLGKLAETGRGFWTYETGCVDRWNRPAGDPFKTMERTTHILDLEPGFESIWSNQFDKSKRKQTRRAEREGVTIVESTGETEAKQFYRIYARRIGEAGGKLHYPEALFVELAGRGGDFTRLFLAYLGGELLGGQLNFYYGPEVIAWYGITTIESRERHAGTALYTHIIRHACDHGYQRLNLGGSIGKVSVMDYKSSFGAEPHLYCISTIRAPVQRVAAALKRFKD